MADASDDTIVPADGQSTPEVSRKWLDVIARYDASMFTWAERVRKIHKIYVDDRSQGDSDNTLANRRKFNLYWANIQTLQPAIFQKMPTPSVNRRYKDDDRVARVASEMVERAITYQWDMCAFTESMKLVRDDYLHAGRGQVWLRYEPEVEDDQLKDENVCIDYVAWSDFGHNVARTWDEVTCVWRKAYLTRRDGIKRFGDRFKEVGLDHRPDQDERPEDGTTTREDKATVYEIWDRPTNSVYFVAKSYTKGPLEVTPPFLDFEGFFPCPKPVYGTLKSGSLVPVPDYVLYQDQLEEIDELTIRMGKLLDALKLVGFYPSANGEASQALEKAMKPGVENQMIPVPTWGEFKEGGGATGLIEWWPVEQVGKVLDACYTARKALIDDVYQITGISDIVRGETDANETATAQQIKTQWGSIRIRDRQMELARFARDVARLTAEIICDKFQPETLMAQTNIKLPTDAAVQQMLMAQVQQQALAAQAAAPPAMPTAGAPQAALPPPSGAPAPPQPPMQGPPQ